VYILRHEAANIRIYMENKPGGIRHVGA